MIILDLTNVNLAATRSGFLVLTQHHRLWRREREAVKDRIRGNKLKKWKRKDCECKEAIDSEF